MTDLYMDQPGSKKKYLVPLLILLLCAVSLTGAGFAYNSSVTADSPEVPVQSFELEIGTKNVITLTGTEAIVFNSAVTNTSAAQKTVYTVDSENSKLSFTVKINANENKTASATVKTISFKVKDTSGDVVEGLSAAVTADSDVKVGTALNDTAQTVKVQFTGSITFDDFTSAPESSYILEVYVDTNEVVKESA